jgi:NitT/TauT family transport system substrate-binding protein
MKTGPGRFRAWIDSGENLFAVAGSLVGALCAAIMPACAQEPDRVRVQLRWFHQAQFAGTYTAVARGFYEAEKIVVELSEGGPGINPLQRLADGQVDVAVGWLPNAIALRQRGQDVVNIAQIFQHSGMAVICRRDAGIRTSVDIPGKSIGVWNVGDEKSVRSWLEVVGIGPDRVKLVPQQSDGKDLIEGRVPCATAMTYNEYWSILRGGLTPGDLIVFRLSDYGQGFLEDGIYARATSLGDPQKRDVLVRFLRATLRGWSYAIENIHEGHAITMAVAPSLDAIHQGRMLEAVIELIGDKTTIGLLDLHALHRSVQIVAGARGTAELLPYIHGAWTQRLWEAAMPEAVGNSTISRSTRHYLIDAVSSRWFYLLDLIGTAAFGIAGFMRARERDYDLWGALILTMLPAVGGGTLRDLLVGGDRYPPFIFQDPTYTYIVLGIVVVGTLLSRITSEKATDSLLFKRSLLIFDTVGLSTFAVIGAKVALVADLSLFWVPFCAALTCAGGGMLLDIVTGREPRTFKGEPYEELAVAGAFVLLLCLEVADIFEHQAWIVTASIVVTLVFIFVLRLVVVKTGWRTYRLHGVPRRRRGG